MIFIGCDGGSTKTEWLLCNERGRVLAHRTFSGCNCAFLGEDGFARLMADSAESLLADAGINAADVASAMFALTGYGEIPGTESSFPAALRAALPGCGQILIDNDSVAGWVPPKEELRILHVQWCLCVRESPILRLSEGLTPRRVHLVLAYP